MKGLWVMDLGSSDVLIVRVKEAVKACKINLKSNLERMLALADPKNGEKFISEVL